MKGLKALGLIGAIVLAGYAMAVFYSHQLTSVEKPQGFLPPGPNKGEAPLLPTTETKKNAGQMNQTEDVNLRAPTGTPTLNALTETALTSFNDEIRKIEKSLPTQAEAKHSDEHELHGAPQGVKSAAVALGDLAQRLADRPELRPEGLEFYKRCALNSSYLNSVRALCFGNAQRLSAELYKEAWAYDPAAIPREVIGLSTRL